LIGKKGLPDSTKLRAVLGENCDGRVRGFLFKKSAGISGQTRGAALRIDVHEYGLRRQAIFGGYICQGDFDALGCWKVRGLFRWNEAYKGRIGFVAHAAPGDS
jgi:hypothetical protein